MVCEMVGNHCFCRLRQYGLLRGRTGKGRCARAPISCTSLSLPHSSSSRLHEESSSICVLHTPLSGQSVAATTTLQLRESIVFQPEKAPRVDAQASLERTGIGGWRRVKDKNGNIDTRLSPWFSVEIRREDWPWIYERDDKPALVISTLEALAIFIALKLFLDALAAHTEER